MVFLEKKKYILFYNTRMGMRTKVKKKTEFT